MFPYIEDVLLKPFEGENAPIRAKLHPRVLVVMTGAEVKGVLSLVSRINLHMTKFLYGSGLRLMECDPHTGVVRRHHVVDQYLAALASPLDNRGI